jgi:hypothetical protein
MKGKTILFVLVAVVGCLLTFFASDVAFAAFEFADGRIFITGWLENFTSLGLTDGNDDGVHKVNEKGTIHTFRNTLQVETTAKLTPEVTFFLLTRGYYEGSWDLGNRLDKSPEDRNAVPGGDPMKEDFEAREYHVTAKMGDFTFKLGRQQVVWGESDAIRISDIINPLDLSWHYNLDNWEDMRIPLRMANIIYSPPSEHQLTVQLVYIPEDFRPNQFAPAGAVWGMPGVPQVVWDQMKAELPKEHSLSNGQIGERVQWTMGGWEFSLLHLYHRVDSAVYTFDPTHNPLPLRFSWPFVNTVGGTFNKFEKFTSTVFRGEMAVTFKQPFTSIPLDRIIEKDTVAFMLGFDRPTMWTWLNPNKAFFISGQWYHKHILNHDPDISDPVIAGHKRQDILTLLVNTSYWHDRITPQFLGVYDTMGNGFLQPSIKYSPNQNWDVTLAANFLFGREDNDGYWGPVRKSSEVYLKTRFKF